MSLGIGMLLLVLLLGGLALTAVGLSSIGFFLLGTFFIVLPFVMLIQSFKLLLARRFVLGAFLFIFTLTMFWILLAFGVAFFFFGIFG